MAKKNVESVEKENTPQFRVRTKGIKLIFKNAESSQKEFDKQKSKLMAKEQPFHLFLETRTNYQSEWEVIDECKVTASYFEND